MTPAVCRFKTIPYTVKRHVVKKHLEFVFIVKEERWQAQEDTFLPEGRISRVFSSKIFSLAYQTATYLPFEANMSSEGSTFQQPMRTITDTYMYIMLHASTSMEVSNMSFPDAFRMQVINPDFCSKTTLTTWLTLKEIRHFFCTFLNHQSHQGSILQIQMVHLFMFKSCTPGILVNTKYFFFIVATL